MSLKYVVMKRKADNRLLFVIGHEVFNHGQLAFWNSNYDVINAGFVSLNLYGPKENWAVNCWGDSVTLKLKAVPATDEELILNQIKGGSVWFQLVDAGVEQGLIVSAFDELDRNLLFPWQVQGSICGCVEMLIAIEGAFIPASDPREEAQPMPIVTDGGTSHFLRCMHRTLNPY